MAKLHLGIDLDRPSLDVGLCLEVPPAPLARLGCSTKAPCYMSDCTARPASASLDLCWSKKMANFSQCHRGQLQVEGYFGMSDSSSCVVSSDPLYLPSNTVPAM